ncbi:hypothetical protein PGJ85_018095 (plasmid) [Acinetobacter baumannii]|uniref:Uncharacterized protein n=1 Tax=Acinetobacter nosocomialis TaxID=106654 RepID=A0AB37D0H9_ACINO|nr:MULTISPECIES: hypothetical protein [Acinetobacter calcoaceticus/baumannii complex]AMM30642.1 hypothetical protein AYJ52_19485 [Acinetobacter pittii]MCJ9255153.1 hypothetical protein [Acinetobacter baumannii]MCJ9258679.1 hypothetical protein [Acinetobacter baumannii]MDA4917536.1 hypothetical protein [Acinetobacter baumannii]MDA4920372.1 hypothetical protein [Acinetobacter baumannii]
MNPENKTNEHLNQDNLDLVSTWSNLKNESAQNTSKFGKNLSEFILSLDNQLTDNRVSLVNLDIVDEIETNQTLHLQLRNTAGKLLYIGADNDSISISELDKDNKVVNTQEAKFDDNWTETMNEYVNQGVNEYPQEQNLDEQQFNQNLQEPEYLYEDIAFVEYEESTQHLPNSEIIDLDRSEYQVLDDELQFSESKDLVVIDSENDQKQEIIDDVSKELVKVNGQEFFKRKLNSNQEELLLKAMQLLQEKNANYIYDNFTPPTSLVPTSNTNANSDLVASGGKGGSGGTVKNYSLFPNLSNLFKDRSQTAMQELNTQIDGNKDPSAVIANRYDSIKSTIANDEMDLKSVVANQLICEKYNDVLDAHQNYSQSIDDFWKFDKMDDFRGQMVEYGKANNKDINTIVNELNKGENEPLRKMFQNQIDLIESTPKGKQIISNMYDSHQNFVNKTNSAVDVLKNGEVDLSLKEKFSKDLTQIVENQESISNQVPNFIDKDGKKFNLGEEMKRYAEQIKSALKAVVEFVKSKVGITNNQDVNSYSPTP